MVSSACFHYVYFAILNGWSRTWGNWLLDTAVTSSTIPACARSTGDIIVYYCNSRESRARRTFHWLYTAIWFTVFLSVGLSLPHVTLFSFVLLKLAPKLATWCCFNCPPQAECHKGTLLACAFPPGHMFVKLSLNLWTINLLADFQQTL